MLQFSPLNAPSSKKSKKKAKKKYQHKLRSFQIISRKIGPIPNSKYHHKPYGKCHSRIRRMLRRQKRKR